MQFENKIFEYDVEDLEYHEVKGHILVSKGLALFIMITFLVMVLFSFATVSKYLEAKSNEKIAKEVAVELNSELQQSELDLYYWKENQLIQNKNESKNK
jgi:hypothetical protein